MREGFQVKQVFTGSTWELMGGYSRAIRMGHRIEVAGTPALQNGELSCVGDPYEQR
ncbi:hypothetical protein MHH60_06075 [Paenibacillus sp. FSL H7-0716]|uniref:hypothetical protein n=1 Tax=Paenibacillus TaxID=44249 RepID=UPI0026B66CC3|nr:hypothetical protein [Paenibacillus odorifer]